MSDSTQKTIFCSECSREAGEQAFGTAPRTDVWLLLEYSGPWGAQALAESDLSADLKGHLNGWLEAIPNSKFVFIKRERPTAGVAFFVALSREGASRLYQFRLDRYDDLCSLDIPALAAGAEVYADRQTDAPLFIVCTNGRRDVACSKYGVPIFQAMERVAGPDVWQCTHIGGHRFAATLACLPHGLCYGYVDAEDVEEIVADYRAGRVVNVKTRGLYYDAPIQAAEYFLRGRTGLAEIDSLRLLGIDAMGPGNWAVRFSDSEGQTHAVRVEQRLSGVVTYQNSSDPEPKPMPQFFAVE